MTSELVDGSSRAAGTVVRPGNPCVVVSRNNGNVGCGCGWSSIIVGSRRSSGLLQVVMPKKPLVEQLVRWCYFDACAMVVLT